MLDQREEMEETKTPPVPLTTGACSLIAHPPCLKVVDRFRIHRYPLA